MVAKDIKGEMSHWIEASKIRCGLSGRGKKERRDPTGLAIPYHGRTPKILGLMNIKDEKENKNHAGWETGSEEEKYYTRNIFFSLLIQSSA